MNWPRPGAARRSRLLLRTTLSEVRDFSVAKETTWIHHVPRQHRAGERTSIRKLLSAPFISFPLSSTGLYRTGERLGVGRPTSALKMTLQVAPLKRPSHNTIIIYRFFFWSKITGNEIYYKVFEKNLKIFGNFKITYTCTNVYILFPFTISRNVVHDTVLFSLNFIESGLNKRKTTDYFN